MSAAPLHPYPDTEPMRRPVAAVLQELSDVIEAVRGDRSIVRVSGLCGNAQDVGVVGIDSLQETIKRACAELTANGAPSVAGRIGKDIAIAICALAAEQSSTPIQSTAQISELDDASNACLELAAKHGYATGHGDTVADMIREFSAQIPIRAPAQGETKPAGALAVEYTVDAKGSIQLSEGAPFDGKPVLIKLAAGWCEAYWEDARVGQNQDGTTYDGFCWVYMDGEGIADLDDAKFWARLPDTCAVTSTHSRCAKCHCETKGEAALVDGKIWCHPCADAVPSTSRCTCAAIVNPNIPHARTCPLSSTDGASR